MKEFIETGKIVNIHGLRGEVKIMPWSDDPILSAGLIFFIAERIKKYLKLKAPECIRIWFDKI